MISRKSNARSLNFASKSLDMSLKNFDIFLRKPNKNYAEKMGLAANLAGKAISISKTTAPHAVSYPFTSLFNVSHGHAVSLFFEKFFIYNFENISMSNTNFALNERYKKIFKIFNVNNISEFSIKIKEIKSRAGLIDDLSKLNINLDLNINKIIKGINILRLSNNPVKIDEEIIKKIILNKY